MQVEDQRSDGDHFSKVDAKRQLQRDKERLYHGKLTLTGHAQASGGVEAIGLRVPSGESVGSLRVEINKPTTTVAGE